MPDYLSESTITALRSGKVLNMPGFQLNGKFIVAGKYVTGDLTEARKQYHDYIDSCTSFDVMTWERFAFKAYKK